MAEAISELYRLERMLPSTATPSAPPTMILDLRQPDGIRSKIANVMKG